MGTSEIYRAVLALDEIVDALVVDVPRAGAESWMALFVVLGEGEELSAELTAEIKRSIKGNPWAIDRRIAEATQMPVHVADDPLTCVVRGTGRVLEELDTLERVMVSEQFTRAPR